MTAGCYPLMATPSAKNRLAADPLFNVGDSSPAYTVIRKAKLLEALQRAVAEATDVDVNPSAFDYATAFIKLLPAEAPEPSIVIEDDGEVAFDWGDSTRSTFSVSIGGDGTLRFGGLFGYQTRYGSDQLTSSIPKEILGYIHKTTVRPTG